MFARMNDIADYQAVQAARSVHRQLICATNPTCSIPATSRNPWLLHSLSQPQ
jgi:hypothetical protein